MNVFDAESLLNNPKPNDLLFLQMAIDKVVDDFSQSSYIFSSVRIDRSRVYIAGHSNGCIASLLMAALYSDAVAAVCCHSGALVTPFDVDTYNSPVPIWMVHGEKDETISFDGENSIPPFPNRGFWSMPDTLEYLSKANGYTEEDTIDIEDMVNSTEVVNVNSTAINGESVVGTVFQRTKCTQGATVELVALLESGHDPYPNIEWDLDGETRTTIDTTAMAWEFYRAHTKLPPSKPLVLEESPPQESIENENGIPADVEGEEPEPKPQGTEEEESSPSMEEADAEEDPKSKEEKGESSGSTPRLSFASQGFGIDLLFLLSLVATLIK